MFFTLDHVRLWSLFHDPAAESSFKNCCDSFAFTNVGGFVLDAVAERSQPRWLQQLVDAVRHALFEGQVALHYTG